MTKTAQFPAALPYFNTPFPSDINASGRRDRVNAYSFLRVDFWVSSHPAAANPRGLLVKSLRRSVTDKQERKLKLTRCPSHQLPLIHKLWTSFTPGNVTRSCPWNVPRRNFCLFSHDSCSTCWLDLQLLLRCNFFICLLSFVHFIALLLPLREHGSPKSCWHRDSGICVRTQMQPISV